MSKVKRKILNLGASTSKIGLNKVIETTKRRLLNVDEQSIDGGKSLASPPLTPLFPCIDIDAVPKKSILEASRCLAVFVEETLTVTQTDVNRGYLVLGKEIASNQRASFEIVDMTGAGAMALDQDYTLIAHPGLPTRLQWENWPMGRPGRVAAGQKITVRYNTCAESEFGKEFSQYRLWSAEKTVFTEADSGGTVVLTRAADGRAVSVPLPVIGAGSTLTLTAAAGHLLLYSLPVALENGEAPYFVGKYTVFSYDGIGWQKRIESTGRLGRLGFPSGARAGLMDFTVMPVEEDKIGLYVTYDLHSEVEIKNGKEAWVAIYDRNFQFLKDTGCTTDGAYSSNRAFTTVANYRNGKLIPTYIGIMASGTRTGQWIGKVDIRENFFIPGDHWGIIPWDDGVAIALESSIQAWLEPFKERGMFKVTPFGGKVLRIYTQQDMGPASALNFGRFWAFGKGIFDCKAERYIPMNSPHVNGPMVGMLDWGL